MEFKSKLKRKVLTGQTRELIANVIFFMQREASEQRPVKKRPIFIWTKHISTHPTHT